MESNGKTASPHLLNFYSLPMERVDLPEFADYSPVFYVRACNANEYAYIEGHFIEDMREHIAEFRAYLIECCLLNQDKQPVLAPGEGTAFCNQVPISIAGRIFDVAWRLSRIEEFAQAAQMRSTPDETEDFLKNSLAPQSAMSTDLPTP